MLPRDFDIFSPLASEDVPEADHILERRPVEQQRRERVQRVEPAARLVDRLGDDNRPAAAVSNISWFSNG